MQAMLIQMIDRVLRHVDDVVGISPGVKLRMRSRIFELMAAYRPMLCLMPRGLRQTVLGGQALRYDPASGVVSPLDLTGAGCLVEARPDRLFIMISQAIDIDDLATMLPELPPSKVVQRKKFAIAPPSLLDL